MSINPESASHILGVAKEEYLAVERRIILLTSKTQTLITAATIILTLISVGLFTSAKNNFNVTLMYLSFASSMIGLLIALGVLLSQPFHRVKFELALTDSELEKKPEIIATNLAKSYEEAIGKSNGTLNLLVKAFDFAVWCFEASLIFIALAIFFQPKGLCMSETKEKSDQSSPNTDSKDKPETGSYGVETIKKSEDVANIKIRNIKQEDED